MKLIYASPTTGKSHLAHSLRHIYTIVDTDDVLDTTAPASEQEQELKSYITSARALEDDNLLVLTNIIPGTLDPDTTRWYTDNLSVAYFRVEGTLLQAFHKRASLEGDAISKGIANVIPEWEEDMHTKWKPFIESLGNTAIVELDEDSFMNPNVEYILNTPIINPNLYSDKALSFFGERKMRNMILDIGVTTHDFARPSSDTDEFLKSISVDHLVFCGADAVVGTLMNQLLKTKYGEYDIVHQLRTGRETWPDVEYINKSTVLSTCWSVERTVDAIRRYCAYYDEPIERVRLYDGLTRVQLHDRSNVNASFVPVSPQLHKRLAKLTGGEWIQTQSIMSKIDGLYLNSDLFPDVNLMHRNGAIEVYKASRTTFHTMIRYSALDVKPILSIKTNTSSDDDIVAEVTRVLHDKRHKNN